MTPDQVLVDSYGEHVTHTVHPHFRQIRHDLVHVEKTQPFYLLLVVRLTSGEPAEPVEEGVASSDHRVVSKT